MKLFFWVLNYVPGYDAIDMGMKHNVYLPVYESAYPVATLDVMNVLRNAQDTPHLLSKQKVVSELQSVGY
jgi:hypothetical protein